jgi:pullulanase
LALRRAHPAFRLPTRELIQQHLEFLPNLPPGTIAYRLRDHAGGDEWRNIVVAFNGNRTATSVTVPQGSYTVVLRGDQLKLEGIEKIPPSAAPFALKMPPSTATILVEK